MGWDAQNCAQVLDVRQPYDLCTPSAGPADARGARPPAPQTDCGRVAGPLHAREQAGASLQTHRYLCWRRSNQAEGFLPEEREWFDSILSPRTLVDVVRRQHPGVDGPYSWWSWLGQSFVNDIGWRIDYHLATPDLARAAVTAGTDRDPAADRRMSDHAPVVVDYDF